MTAYRHKTLGVVIEVESKIGGEWEKAPTLSPSEEQTEEKKPKKTTTRKTKK